MAAPTTEATVESKKKVSEALSEVSKKSVYM